MSKSVGLDLGSQKTMIVKDDADIILTDTGSVSRPTLVSFQNRTRLFGEEAFPQILSESTFAQLNLLAGRSYSEVVKSVAFAHKNAFISEDENGRLLIEINYCGEKKKVFVTSLLGMYLSKLYERIVAVNGPDAKLSFALPPHFTTSTERAYREACEIAGIDTSKLFFTETSDCLVVTYGRKLSSLRPNEKSQIEGKNVVLIEMGHTQTTAVVVNVNTNIETSITTATKLSTGHDGELGAYYFDLKLFEHFATICKNKNNTVIELNSKRGMRLLTGCERIRKLLSQLPESQITVEHLTDDGDISFSLKRDEFASLCSTLIERFKAVIMNAISSAGVELSSVAAVEILGGGVRMPIVQAVITQLFGDSIVLGAKFDDASVALGAALLCNQATAANVAATLSAAMDVASSQVTTLPVPPPVTAVSSVGLTPEEVSAERAKEVSMQAIDLEIKQLQAARNKLESYILEMRNAPKHKKHGSKINASELNRILDSNEEWLWDTADDTSVTVSDVNVKFTTLVTETEALCAEYLAAVEADRQAVEKDLEAEAVKAAAEREANGEEDEDHDTRKLKKPERMRLVVKNKEEGNELFKGGNYRPAGARYHKALTHCSKFFDMSAEDTAEINGIKLSLYLNLASVYIKLANWDNVLRNCNDALAIDVKNAKALFRRGTYHENKKDWEKALQDFNASQAATEGEDKLVTKAVDRVKKEIQKEKDKEKKMWGKAFA